MILVTACSGVERMKKVSSPSSPSISSDSSAPEMVTLRPAPKTPSSVITNSSPNSEPSATTVSKPAPPSMSTGALMLYSIWSSPAPAAIWARICAVVWPSASLTKARTTKVSLPASPSIRSTAWLE